MELTACHVLFWWQNRFPAYASITAPVVRIQVARLSLESQLVLRLAYLQEKLREFSQGEDDLNSLPYQLDWLPLDARPTVIANLRIIEMIALADHLAHPENVIPHHVLMPTVEALEKRLNSYLGEHESVITTNMETMTGQSLGALIFRQPSYFKQSKQAAIAERLLLKNQRLLLKIERIDKNKELLEESLVAPSINPVLAKQQWREFQREVENCLSMIGIDSPELAEQWAYDCWQWMDLHQERFS